MPTIPSQAQWDIRDELVAGRLLWGPINRHVGTGELREPGGDYVRPVQRSSIAKMLKEGIIVKHPTIPNRYILS